MSSHYTTEPPASASVILHTTAGPIPLSLFATQTPLTTRNFLQHCLDGTYDGVLWHRVAAGFVIQTGDPTGTGEGGESIYEDREFERYDKSWAKLLGREERERIVFRDEVHGRLKFNRRGLVGMAKQEGGGYGSQFFVTLGDVRAELDGKCTMFGRVEGEGIYNVVKIAEGEVDGERPLYPEKVLRVEVLEMPKGEAWEGIRRRVRVEQRVEEKVPVKKKVVKKQKKTLLSFGADEEGDEEGDVAIKPRKAKFNTALIDGGGDAMKDESGGNKVSNKPEPNGHPARKPDEPPPAKRRKPSVSPSRREKLLASMTAQSPPTSRSPEASATKNRRKPSFHDSTTQLPLKDQEVPSRSLSGSRSRSQSPNTSAKGPSKSSLEAEIATLKASMRRNAAPVATKSKKLSALEAMIPATSTRGRKRPRPGETNANAADEKRTMDLLNAFKARLDSVKEIDTPTDPDRNKINNKSSNSTSKRLKRLRIDSSDDPSSKPQLKATPSNRNGEADGDKDNEEAPLCDLHFIANCQSCSRWDSHALASAVAEDDDGSGNVANNDDADDDPSWMAHQLSFARDQLGKDLEFKKRNEALEELVVIDPREKGGRIAREEREKKRERKAERERGRR